MAAAAAAALTAAFTISLVLYTVLMSLDRLV